MNILERYESFAQNSVRTTPIFFDKAQGSEVFDEMGNRYIDFGFAGGTLSYGHNNHHVCNALVNYLSADRVLQTCDRASVAKRTFIEVFVNKILQPRNLSYKMLFTDPAAGSALDMALRLVRRHKEVSSVVAFTDSSHGLTDASTSAGGLPPSFSEPLASRNRTTFMPFCGFLGDGHDTLAYFRRYLEDSASGLGHPAAVVVETVQVHGGVHIASEEWLRGLEKLCREFRLLLIVDETLTGSYRTGSYFSFEKTGIRPDIVVMSNAIAAGLPMSMLLLRPELDYLRPGLQAGVFQGNALAYVAATQLLAQSDEGSSRRFAQNREMLSERLSGLAARFPNGRLRVRGTGMIWGLDFGRPGAAAVVSTWALERGIIVEPAGFKNDVLLVLPPITIEHAVLQEGLNRLEQAVTMFLGHKSREEKIQS